MRPSRTVVYHAIDNLISVTGKPLTGFPEFLEALAQASLPGIWVSSRTRAQLDAALRKFGHGAPYIAEGGSGVYLPEDYFHLKAERTVRLGRFTCIPVAAPRPAAAEALDSLASKTGISVVPLRSLSPRELVQNTGLPQREAELLRLRDFDELFFFAGATEADVERFRGSCKQKGLQLRERGPLWSLSAGADLAKCVRELSKLFERAMHAHPFSVAIATAEEGPELFPLCQRGILLSDRSGAGEPGAMGTHPAITSIPLFSPGTWDAAFEAVSRRRP